MISIYILFFVLICIFCIGFFSKKKLMLYIKNVKRKNFLNACAIESDIGKLDNLFKKLKLNNEQEVVLIHYFYGILQACSYNKNINTIEYLYQKIKNGGFDKNGGNAYLFLTACTKNPNLHIIEYLAILFNVYNLTVENEFVILWISHECEHINNMKFLIEEIKINIKVIDDDGYSCFEIAGKNNGYIYSFFCYSNYNLYMKISDFKLKKNKKKIYECLKLLNI